ncbi:MAG: Gfo/Idh/MocA family oxidoreductase [Acidobacteria bacterium]|nr:Gfo/Idh/MocA family oxidoreductase [Acidobacteriota bacterium]
MDRRTLIAAGAGALFAQNNRPKGAIIGSGGRGQFLTGEFKEIGVEMAAVCDVYEPNLQKGLQIANTGAKGYSDYRKLLDDKSIGVVVVATPDHWHSRMVVDAVEAGKDVYVEKPLAHTIEEGFAIVEAQKRTGRIVQVGTQRRSFDLFLDAKRLYDSNVCGDVRLVSSYWYNHQASLSSRQLEGKLDWQQWLGTSPKRDLDAKRFFNWYYYWDYSGGLLIGQAAHIIDAVQWFLNANAPVAVTCAGSKPNLDGAEVPETASLTVEYADNTLVNFLIGYRAMKYAGVNDQLKQFHGSKARFDVGREGYALFPESPKDIVMKPSVVVSKPGSFGTATRQHIRNFLEAVQTRQQPSAPPAVAQGTNIVLCMAMQSLREGRRLRWDAASRKVLAS